MFYNMLWIRAKNFTLSIFISSESVLIEQLSLLVLRLISFYSTLTKSCYYITIFVNRLPDSIDYYRQHCTYHLGDGMWCREILNLPPSLTSSTLVWIIINVVQVSLLCFQTISRSKYLYWGNINFSTLWPLT